MNKIISVKNLSFDYPDKKNTLDNITFDVEEGDTLCLLGPNGAGKTTLLFCLAGLFEFQGEITVAGLRQSRGNFADIRKKIGFLFQNPDDQFFMPTVMEDVAIGIKDAGYSEDEIKTRVKNVLSRVGLNDSLEKTPHHLSFGEKKRIALAGVLVTHPDILILDEPTLGLDPPGRRRFTEILKDIKATKIVATHDINFATDIASKIAFIENGKIVKYGLAREVLSSAELKHFV